MKQFFENYLQLFFNPNEHVYFLDLLWNSQDYFYFMMSILFIPLIVIFIFYKLVDPVLPKIGHWLAAYLISYFLVVISCYMIIINGSMNICVIDPNQCPEIEHITQVIIKASLIVGFLALATGFGYSLVFKLISTNNKRNPF